jgi:hypothetical protein
VRIKQAITQAVTSLWPDVYGVANATLTVTGRRDCYALPAATEDVINVKHSAVGETAWYPLRSWRFDKTANLTAYPTGRTLTVPVNYVQSGQTVQALVKTRPAITDSTVDWNALGLLDSVQDVVVYHALYRLTGAVDLGYVDGQSASAAFAQRSENRSTGSAMSRQFFALYQDALERERGRVVSRVQPSLHFVG